MNPREAPDSDVRLAVAAWDEVANNRDKALSAAGEICARLKNGQNHRAYGWAVATCGRIAAYRGFHDIAESYLASAFGHFFVCGETYGQEMVKSNLSIPAIARGNLARGLELALGPLASGIQFEPFDLSLLHNVAAMCHSERDEFHAALFQLHSEYEITGQLNHAGRTSTVLGNLGVVLDRLGEHELALVASTRAWEIQLASTSGSDLQLAHLSNLVEINCALDRLNQARAHAELLYEHLGHTNHPITWTFLRATSAAFVRTGAIEKGRLCFNRARELTRSCIRPVTEAGLESCRLLFLEAEGRYREVVDLGKQMLASPPSEMLDITRRELAGTVQRCYTALGYPADARYWREFRRGVGRDQLLGDMLIGKIRASLQVELPAAPLTRQELTCLRLSANGQTSADIGLKLGIKPRTVNFHFSKILRKLNAANRQEAIAKAANANLLRNT